MRNLAIYFFDYYVVCFGNIIDMVPHSHHYLQVCIGVRSDFNVYFEDQTIQSKAVIINNDIRHQFHGNDDHQLIILIDPESSIGIKMKQLCTAPYYNLENNYCEMFNSMINTLSNPPHSEVNKVIENFFIQLTGITIHHKEMDPRVKKVQETINNGGEESSISELADSVFLSESRLLHLFKEEIGIPIKQYALWRKLINAVYHILEEDSFTDAAFAGGFSDSPHLSRTFKRMFGVTLSDVFKNSNSVQVFLADKK